MTLQIEGKRFGKLKVLRVSGYDRYKNVLWECVCDCGMTCISRATDLRKGKQSCSLGCGHTLNLSGKRFGSLVVRHVVSKNDGDGVLWECVCDCGNIVVVPVGRLNRRIRPTRSCGCSKRTKDIVGRRFGKLTVVSAFFNGVRTRTKCVCECGKETEVRASQLVSNSVLSCGCLKRRRGKDNPLWMQNISQDERLTYRNRYYGWPELRDVKKRVHERDDYRCSCCGCKSSKGHPLVINAHHLDSWCVSKGKRLDVNNMVTVCSPCHRLFHSLYGNRNNSEQFLGFTRFFLRVN